MKVYKLLTVATSAFIISSCVELSNPLEDINISVQQDEGVTVENNVITVSRNTPVKFNIAGEPDNITFFSGEKGHNYDFRSRTTIDARQIKSSKLTFQISTKSSTAAAYVDLFNMYISESFPGLNKDNFEEDCNLLAGFAEWSDLESQDKFPKKAEEETQHEIDMTPYLGSNVTLAIHYHPRAENEDFSKNAQPRLDFNNFKITNELVDGSETELLSGSMGFTPVNVWSANLENVTIKEDDLKKNTGYYDEQGNLIESALWYGTTTNNISGMWNLKNASSTGSFDVHGTGKGEGLRESWLVSDYLVINSCTPDRGVAIKNISNNLSSYEYTYEEVGTYKAVFLMANSNYKEDDSKVVTMIINVK